MGTFELVVKCRFNDNGGMYKIKVFSGKDCLAWSDVRFSRFRFEVIDGVDDLAVIVNDPMPALTNVGCDRAVGGLGIGAWVWDSAVALLPAYATAAERSLVHEVLKDPRGMPPGKWDEIFMPRLADYYPVPDSDPPKWQRVFIPATTK